MPSASIVQNLDMGTIALSGTTAKFVVAQYPMRIVRLKMVVTTAVTSAAAVVTINVFQADGTATTPSGAAAGGTMTVPVSAINSVHYINLDETVGELIVYPGEQISIVSAGASVAGGAVAAFEVEPLSWTDVSQRLVTSPGGTDLPTTLAGANKVIA